MIFIEMWYFLFVNGFCNTAVLLVELMLLFKEEYIFSENKNALSCNIHPNRVLGRSRRISLGCIYNLNMRTSVSPKYILRTYLVRLGRSYGRPVCPQRTFMGPTTDRTVPSGISRRTTFSDLVLQKIFWTKISNQNPALVWVNKIRLVVLTIMAFTMKLPWAGKKIHSNCRGLSFVHHSNITAGRGFRASMRYTYKMISNVHVSLKHDEFCSLFVKCPVQFLIFPAIQFVRNEVQEEINDGTMNCLNTIEMLSCPKSPMWKYRARRPGNVLIFINIKPVATGRTYVLNKLKKYTPHLFRTADCCRFFHTISWLGAQSAPVAS